MSEKEKHDYFGFDRFIQVVDTPYEKELLEIEKKYYNEEIDEQEFNKLWNKIMEKVLNEKEKK